MFQQEVEKITEGIVQRAAHDFKGFHLLERFKDFNSARQQDPEYLLRLEKAKEKYGNTAKVRGPARKASQRFRREYAFPAGINDDPMAFLDEVRKEKKNCQFISFILACIPITITHHISSLLFSSHLFCCNLQDLDQTLAIQDNNLKALEQSRVEEGRLNDRQKAAAEAHKKKLEAK